jgi:molybdopterin-containing oxidoreductase family membrane subunit
MSATHDESHPVDSGLPPILGGSSFHDLTEAMVRPLERPPTRGWWLGFVPSVALVGLFGVAAGWIFHEGVGVWGLNRPVAWAFDFTSLLFWAGVGLGGTLVSAGLLLLRQRWRGAIRRASEATACCALICAACVAALHLGRPWLAYWLAPAPNQMGTWPQFRSPLVWSLFAVGACGTVTALLSYVGLLPDLATLRDRSQGTRRKTFGALALGWRGSLRHWHHHERACRILAGSAAALSLWALAVVSMNLATPKDRGWHGALLPMHFVAGAVLSGVATIVALLVIACRAPALGRVITREHLEHMARLLRVASLSVGSVLALEFLVAWTAGGADQRFAAQNRALGPVAWAFWTAVACSVVAPQLLWFERIRGSLVGLFALAILADVGTWLGIFVTLVPALHYDFLPASWSGIRPTFWDVATLLGSFGVWVALACLFVRFLPFFGAAEVKAALSRAATRLDGHDLKDRNSPDAADARSLSPEESG